MKLEEIRKIRCFILDMDGTIYLGDRLFDFTREFLETVERTGRSYYYFTNNSSRGMSTYVERMARFGIPFHLGQMMISTHVCIRHLKKHYPGKTIYLVGTPSLRDQFLESGMPLVEEDPDIVILGFDTTLTYEKLARACHYVRKGCIYYGINPDWNCPLEGGNFIPDCGSIARLIEASTGRWPEFFGKPSRASLDYMIEESGFPAREIAVVGDRLYTDIAVAEGSEVTSILVLTGESTRQDAETIGPMPDLIVDSLADLTRVLKEDLPQDGGKADA